MTTAGIWPPAWAPPRPWSPRVARWRPRIPSALINDPFADPLVRAVGLDFFVKMIDGELDFSLLPNASPDRKQAIVDGMGVRTKYFDDYLLAAVQRGRAASGDPGVRAGLPRLPVGLAVGTRCYEIDQPAGDRVQDHDAGRSRRRAHRDATHGPHRLTCRLAGRVAGCRPGHRRTDGLAGRGPADLLAVRSPGPVVRQHHRAERTGQHDRHRIRAGLEGFRRRTGSRDDRASFASTVSTSTCRR